MSAAEQIISNAIRWANGQANVRRLILVGSRARSVAPDELADIDLQVYAATSDPYTRQDAWLGEIGEVWVSVRDQYSDCDIAVPTRLVIYGGGVKADFAFYPAGSSSYEMRAGRPHRILIDKDSGARPGKTDYVSTERIDLPDEAVFRRTVEEFWFEAYHVAKYLVRDELWLAKARDWAAKQFLLRIIEWYELIVRRCAYDAVHAGERAAVSEDIWTKLPRTFAGFDRAESWDAVVAATNLFRRLATDVAGALGYSYPMNVDTKVSRFLLDLRDTGRYRPGPDG